MVSWLCRLGVSVSWQMVAAVAVAMIILGWLGTRQVLRRQSDPRWALLACVGLFSLLFSPVDWVIYQVLLSPLLLLLAYEFHQQGAPRLLWANLVGVWVLTMLVWDPLVSYWHINVVLLVFSYLLGGMAQYYLLLLAAQWLLPMPRLK